MLALLTDPDAWAALVTLTALEIVLGIDNVVFISVLVARLPDEQAKKARQIGLLLALVFRIALLFALTALVRLRYPVVTLFGNEISWHDIILIGGGFFLIAKATHEIHNEMEPHESASVAKKTGAAFGLIIMQVIAVDLVFSIDSIVTAIGMAKDIAVMVAAVIIAVAVMYVAAGVVSAFIAEHPTTKILALAFLVLIGVALVADGFDFHIPRGYIYSAMAFAGAVEAINVMISRKRRAKSQ
jgi:predicted tellurium resistance membrane protein TerC